MFWSFLTTMTTYTHSNNANNIHYRAMFVMKVPFTLTLSLQNNKNKTISHRILNDPENNKEVMGQSGFS